MSDAAIKAPEGVSSTEAVSRNLDEAAASFAKFFPPPPGEKVRAPDGKFAPAQQQGEQQPQAEEPPPEGQPNAAVEGEELAGEEERFEIEVADGEKVELTASELAKLVAEQRRARDALPLRESEETIMERARLAQEREQLARERAAYAQRVNDFIPQAVRALQQDFPEVQSNEDLYKLSVEDPARYVQFQARRDALVAAQNEQMRLQAHFQAEHAARTEKYLNEQRAALEKTVPVFADPVKGPQEKEALRTYLTKKGFTADELAGLTDHRTVIVARNAMLYERMMAAKPEAKKVAPVVRTIRPGAARQTNGSPRTAQAVEAARTNLKKTGSVDALADVFRAQGIR